MDTKVTATNPTEDAPAGALASQSSAKLSPLAQALAKRSGLRSGSADILLIDYSGSMSDYASRGEGEPVRKIDAARQCVAQLREKYTFTQYVFSSECMRSDEIPEPYSGTDLAGALRLIASAEPGRRRVIVVSDGHPDSTADALDAAAQLRCVIDTFYFGPAGGPGEAFLRQLSSLHKGSHGVATEMRQLTAGIAGILTANAESLEAKRAIAL